MSEQKFLIVVDMQKDFIDGALGTAEAQAIVPEAVSYIQACRAAGYTVFATLDTHGPDYLDSAEGKKLPVAHCIWGTEGWELNPEIAKALGNCIRVEKPTFGSLNLPEILKKKMTPGQSVTIDMIGLCTDICVVSNALILKAHFPEAKIRIKQNCCAGVTIPKHRAALDTMQSCQIDLI